MRHYIYISILALLCAFCFSQASAQGISNFGANRPQDTSKTKGQIVGTAYATALPNMYLRATSTGHLVLDTIESPTQVIAGYGIVVDGDTVSLDTALINGVYVKFSDSTISFITPYQFNSVVTSLNLALDEKLNIVDSVDGYVTPYALEQGLSGTVTGSGNVNYVPKFATSSSLTNSTFSDSGNTGRVDYRLTIGRPNPKIADTIHYWGDSHTSGFAVSDTNYTFPIVTTTALNAYAINHGVAGSVLESGTSTPSMAFDYISQIPFWHEGLYAVISYGYNDVTYNHPLFTGLNYRNTYDTVINAFISKGWPVSTNLFINTPFYKPPTTYTSLGGNPAATQARHIQFVDSTLSVCNQYNIKRADQYRYMASLINPRQYLMPDSVHFEILGHLKIAELTLTKLRKDVPDGGQSLVDTGAIITAAYQLGKFDTVGIGSAYQTIVLNNRGFFSINNGAFLPYNLASGTPSSFSFNINGVGRANTLSSDYSIYTGTNLPVPSVNALYGQAIVFNRNSIRSMVCSTGAASELFVNPNAGNIIYGSGTSDAFGQQHKFTGSARFSGGLAIAGTPTFTNTVGGEVYYSSATNGFIIDAFNRSTATGLPIAIAPFGTVVKVGHLASFAGNEKLQVTGNYRQTGSFNVNDNLLITSAGVFSEYKNASAALNRIIIGNGTIYDTATLASGTNTIYSNTGGVVSWSADTTNGATKLATQGDITRALAPYNQYTGWAQYIDNAYTVGSPFVISSTTTDTLENNSGTIINSQLPIDAATELYVSSQNKIRAIDTFDSYIIEVRFTASSSTNFDHFEIGLDIGGSLGYITKQTLTFQKNAGQVQEFKATFSVFSGATFIQNGAAVKITANGGNLSIYDINYLITRTHKAR